MLQEKAVLLKSPGEELQYPSSSSSSEQAENPELLHIRGTKRERECIFLSIQRIAKVKRYLIIVELNGKEHLCLFLFL